MLNFLVTVKENPVTSAHQLARDHDLKIKYFLDKATSTLWERNSRKLPLLGWKSLKLDEENSHLPVWVGIRQDEVVGPFLFISMEHLPILCQIFPNPWKRNRRILFASIWMDRAMRYYQMVYMVSRSYTIMTIKPEILHEVRDETYWRLGCYQ